LIKRSIPVAGHIRHRWVGLAAALAILGAAAFPSPSGAIPSDTEVFSDGFENGLGAWTVVTRVNGTAIAEPGAGTNGSTGAHLVVADTVGSMAYMKRTLPTPTYALSARGKFKVLAAGCDIAAGYSQGSVPFLRFFDATGERLVGLYRINGQCGGNTKLYVQHSGTFWRTGANLKLDTWYDLELRASVAEPGRGIVEVYIGGRLQYATTTATNGIDPIASVNIHNEHPNQVGDLAADDIRLGTFPTTPPANPCAPGTPPPSNEMPGNGVLADGFESFGFSAWTQSEQKGDGATRILTGDAHTGTCAALLHVTSSSGSKAFLSKTLPAGTSTVAADAYFRVDHAGAAGSNVPLFRLFSSTTRVVDVFRENGTGRLFLRTVNASGTVGYQSLGRTVALGTWHRVQVLATVAGASSSLEVRLDDQVLRTGAANLGATTLTNAQVGAEHFAQEMDLVVDDIVFKAS
jgi:hypothetical protein